MRRKVFVCFILIFSINKTVLSQDIFRLNSDTVSSYDILFQEEEDSLMIEKKEKKKKNIFFGIKTKKGFIRSTSGRNLIYENFHYIKIPEISH